MSAGQQVKDPLDISLGDVDWVSDVLDVKVLPGDVLCLEVNLSQRVD